MIDINLVRTDPDLVRRVCAQRGSDVDVERLIASDAELRKAQVRMEALRSEQRSVGRSDLEAARRLKDALQQATQAVRALQEERDGLWVRVPNLLAEDTPPGVDDSGNVELYREGTPAPSDERRVHEAIGRDLQIFDMTRGAEVAGSGFYYWRGDGARLAWAIFSYAQDLLVSRGFEPMMTPLMARDRTFFGTGYLPFFADQLYRVEGTDLSLIGTSEQTLIGYYGDMVIDAEALPIRLTAFTPCFRTEAGAAGRSNRGGFRVHQFHKVEQIVICDPEHSALWLENCQQNIEDLLNGLELPYRVVRVCVGDLGAPAYSKLDTETWFPSFNGYRETHSNSNLTDYQSRRFKIRYKRDGRTVHPHTISATGITDRAALAVLENHRQADGTINLPKALRQYMGGQEYIGKK